jgi:hypothetical protein
MDKAAFLRSSDDALLYLVNCTLATVSSLAMKKGTPKYEFQRQVSIAQTGVDCIRKFQIKVDAEIRLKQVIEAHAGNVLDWASQYKPH